MFSEIRFKPEWRRPAAYAGSALAAVLLVAWLLRDDPVAVDLYELKHLPMRVTIDEEGVTELRNVFRVSAPIAGKVKRSQLKVGDPVREGKTVVASLEPVIPSFLDRRTRRILDARAAAAQSAVALARARVGRAKADLDFRNKELKRANELLKRNTVSRRRFDEAQLAQKTSEAALQTALAELSVRERELESARAQLIEPTAELDEVAANCCVQVYAPVSGRVIRMITESETVVQSGAPLLELGDPSNLEIVVDLLSADAVKVPEGANAEISSWGGVGLLHGIVTRVEPTGFRKVSALGIEEQRVNVRLRIIEPFAKRLRLGHNYRVYVKIIVWSGNKVLSVPLSAMFRKAAEWAVFVNDGGVARLRKVQPGRRNSEHVQILKGLEAGEEVILHPSDRVRDGRRIRERKLPDG